MDLPMNRRGVVSGGLSGAPKAAAPGVGQATETVTITSGADAVALSKATRDQIQEVRVKDDDAKECRAKNWRQDVLSH
jgi:hypothetical protein